jgi:hypothetical protein
MAKFSTKFENPVKVKGYPLTLGVIVDADAPAPLYFQRRYLDINRQLLETKSELIPQADYGKYLRLSIGDDLLECAVFIEADVTDTNINTEGVCFAPPFAITPAAPTNGIVDDTNNTFDFTLSQY